MAEYRADCTGCPKKTAHFLKEIWLSLGWESGGACSPGFSKGWDHSELSLHLGSSCWMKQRGSGGAGLDHRPTDRRTDGRTEGEAMKILQETIEKIESDFGLLLGALREVLEEMGDPVLMRGLPWLEQAGEGFVSGDRGPGRGIHVLSVAFQLLNLVEENAVLQEQRQRESLGDRPGKPGLWRAVFGQLHAAGYTPDAIAAALPGITFILSPVAQRSTCRPSLEGTARSCRPTMPFSMLMTG